MSLVALLRAPGRAGARALSTSTSQSTPRPTSSPLKHVFRNNGSGKVVASIAGENVRLRLVPGESVDTEVVSSGPDAALRVWQDADLVVRVEAAEAAPVSAGLQVDVHVPYRCDAALAAPQGSVEVTHYLEGDLEAHAMADVAVRKVRGMTVALASEQGAVRVAHSVEAMRLTASALAGFSAKKVMAKDADVRVRAGDCSVRAAFVDTCALHVHGGSTAVNGFHGALTFSCEGDCPAVELVGLNGTLQASVERSRAGVVAQFDSMPTGGRSAIACADGDVRVSLPSNQLVDVDVDAAAVTTPEEAGAVRLVAGGPRSAFRVAGSAPEPSRRSHRRQSGKINMTEALRRDHIWAGDRHAGAQATQGAEQDAGQDALQSETEAEPAAAALSVTTTGGTASFEVLGWKQRIQGRFLSSN